MRLSSSAGNSEISRKLGMWRSGITSRCVSAFGLMSRIATNPSAAWTWSPSRASSQKRQSSGSENPLLRDGLAPNGHELADAAAHEPRRVVVAVPAPRAVDEHDVLAAELRPPALERRPARALAQSGSSLSLDLTRHRVG